MDVISDIISLAALVIAILAWRSSSRASRLEHRPMVRVVQVFTAQVRVLGRFPVPAREIDQHRVILKNIGRGPALTVVAFDPAENGRIGEANVVEPLGAGDTEAKRLGRTVMNLKPDMNMDGAYELYYQDVRGTWHLTRFHLRPDKIECTFVGEAKRVPEVVAARGSVARP